MQDSDTQSLIAVDADDRRTGVVEKMAAHGYGPWIRDPWMSTAGCSRGVHHRADALPHVPGRLDLHVRDRREDLQHVGARDLGDKPVAEGTRSRSPSPSKSA